MQDVTEFEGGKVAFEWWVIPQSSWPLPIFSFINLDGKRGIKGESLKAPLANRLIKVVSIFVLYFFFLLFWIPVRWDNKDTHRHLLSLFQEHRQASCTKGPLWWLIWTLKTPPKHHWVCPINTINTTVATTVQIKEVQLLKCPSWWTFWLPELLSNPLFVLSQQCS